MSRNLDPYGYVVRGVTRALMVDLSQPVQVGTEVSAELIQFGSELWPQQVRFSVRWTLTAGSSSGTTLALNPDEPYRFTIPDEASVQIRAELLNNDATTSIDLSMTLTCTNDAVRRTAWSSGNNYERAAAELSADLFQYIEDAANATGANGVSARFVASVLAIEISNRPKTGRATELDEVRDEIIEIVFERHRRHYFDQFNINLYLHRSIGVGQTKMSTLAMALGWMPLIEHERVSGRESREAEIAEAFMRLTTDQMWELWRRLRWPKSAVAAVAMVLAHLKNRPNRYSHLSRSQFSADNRAMAIVATEYNMGATNSPEAAAAPTGYGTLVASLCGLSRLRGGYASVVPALTRFTH